MRAGTLKNPIVIERVTTTNDANSNELVKTWSEFRCLSAHVQARRGREFFEQGQRFKEVVYRFTVRKHEVTDIMQTDRIVFNSQIFDIKAILPDFEFEDRTVIEGTSIV